jgi:hypothetical protein
MHQFGMHTNGLRYLYVSPERAKVVEEAVGNWSFSAHDFADDELLHGAMSMFQHAMSMPELEKWRIGTGKFLRSAILRHDRACC